MEFVEGNECIMIGVKANEAATTGWANIWLSTVGENILPVYWNR